MQGVGWGREGVHQGRGGWNTEEMNGGGRWGVAISGPGGRIGGSGAYRIQTHIMGLIHLHEWIRDSACIIQTCVRGITSSGPSSCVAFAVAYPRMWEQKFRYPKGNSSSQNLSPGCNRCCAGAKAASLHRDLGRILL